MKHREHLAHERGSQTLTIWPILHYRGKPMCLIVLEIPSTRWQQVAALLFWEVLFFRKGEAGQKMWDRRSFTLQEDSFNYTTRAAVDWLRSKHFIFFFPRMGQLKARPKSIFSVWAKSWILLFKEWAKMSVSNVQIWFRQSANDFNCLNRWLYKVLAQRARFNSMQCFYNFNG